MSLCTAEIDTPLGPLTLGLRGRPCAPRPSAIGGSSSAGSPVGAFPRKPCAVLPRVAARFALLAGDLGALDGARGSIPGGRRSRRGSGPRSAGIPAGSTMSLRRARGDDRGADGKPRGGRRERSKPRVDRDPRHRVIARTARPRGYAGGVRRKLQLLAPRH